MSLEPALLNIRMKILGARMREIRLKAGETIDDCARFLGATPEELEQYELGEKPISLPELEVLSYYLQVPLEHFQERENIDSGNGKRQDIDARALIHLRHRMVGAMLRQARLETGISIEELANQLDLDVSQIEAFELGIEPLPMPILESMSGILNRSIQEFQDQKGPIGQWNTQLRALRDFQTLPLDLQSFISKPINQPYLELAMRLSEMPVERLRAVAEGLLEITL